MSFFVITLLILAILYVAKGVIIVQQQETVIIERLGQFTKLLPPGLHWIMPIVETPRPIKKVDKVRLSGETIPYNNLRTMILRNYSMEFFL